MSTADREYFPERPRVNALLEKAIENPVLLVNAGEGYGKTQAVYSFLRRRNEKPVWISLSQRDNDPSHFWENVINAIINNPPARKALEEIGFPESSEQLSRCSSVLEEAAAEKGKKIIVADDCHLLQEGPVSRFFQRLVSFPLPGYTFVLISRHEPPLNTMILLSKGLLSKIGAEDLRFSEEEIAGYFQFRNTPLTTKEKKEILNDTEGWALAISLIEEEMKREKKKYRRSLLESGKVGNMMEALFASIPVSLQRFLVVISFFDHWPLNVLEKIALSLPAKLPSPEKMAEYSLRLSSFFYFDPYFNGFRLHQLFLDFLREKQGEISGDEIKIACSINAKWCMDNHLWINAAINYGMAGDYRGLMNAVYAFPRVLSRRIAASILEVLERVFSDSGRDEGDENFLFLRHVTRAGMIINLGRYEEGQKELLASISLLESWPPSPAASWLLSACYTSLGALSLIVYRKSRDLSRTLEYFQRGNYYHMRCPRPALGAAARASVSTYASPIGYPHRPGEFEEFIAASTRIIPHASNATGGYLSGGDSLCLAELAFFRGDLNAAEQYGREAIFKAREKGQYEIENKSLFYLLRVYLGRGDTSAGLETWEQMEEQLKVKDNLNRFLIHDIMAGWFYAHIGEVRQIAAWLKNEAEESELNENFHNFESMVKAKSLFAEKRYARALEFLRRKELLEGLGSFHLGMLEITVLEAAVLKNMEDETWALKALERAYEMALPAAFDMPFIELGRDMQDLAALALQRANVKIPPAWLKKIQSEASVYGKKLALMAEKRQYRLDTKEIPFLSSRELSVLTGISQGLSREKIAEDSSISINTVKNTIKSIYDKLGAFNRADAIRIAIKAGFLKN
ncbi:MAG: LuxR C-terminal-related transcriptional regulator [Treponema sp.]|nr:LuxR C-terminal-related transcriptional regulator [Treponema sp.]